jgi:Fe/S biogenesis protein NfuA
MDKDEKIQQVIEEEINPRLALHGGGCELVDFSEGILTLRLHGGCSGCPSSKLTLLHGIAPILKDRCPEVKDVTLG